MIWRYQTFLHVLVCLLLTQVLVSCRGWTEEERKWVYEDCIRAAQKQGYEQPEAHCQCVLSRIEQAYPDPTDFEQISIEQLSNLVQQCIDSLAEQTIYWPETTQALFLDSCKRQSVRLGVQNPEAFCQCVMEKSKQQFRTAEDLKNLTPNTMEKIGEECKKLVSKPDSTGK